MKPFEIMYRCCEPGLPVLYKRVRKMLRKIAKPEQGRMRVLDIGGRKSHYTIGVPAKITISELPRNSAIQHHLHLGITDQISSEIRSRRSNVERVVIDDMTRSSLDTGSFECAVAVEVLEHVEEDAEFVRQVRRVLKPNGVFVMTTPNGDFVKNTNPDHKRHYRRSELEALLRSEFDKVEVRYAVPAGTFYDMALQSWSVSRPWKTSLALFGALVNSFEDRCLRRTADGKGMQELIAIAQKTHNVVATES
jgi:SAM-dependent methyltransferase